MTIETDLMIAVRSGCALGRMTESEVTGIIDHLEKLGWTPPAAKPKPSPVAVPVAPAAPTPVAPAAIPVAPAPVAPVAAPAPAPVPPAPVAPPAFSLAAVEAVLESALGKPAVK